MKNSLYIQIQNPCHEKWDEMTVNEQGKFCNNCQNTVIDFSIKTDAEIVQYFNKNQHFCGRFRTTQLEREILKPKPIYKRIINFYSKTAALLFTFFTFKNTHAIAQTQNHKIENFVTNADEIHHEKIIIEGKIIDDEEKLVEEVSIFFDNVKVTSSDINGYYKFEVENIALKNHIVSFSKDKYRSDAFSFHPLMGNTIHDISMCNYKGKECYSMGLSARPNINFEDKIYRHIDFSKEINSNKTFLKIIEELASWLRSNPNSIVKLKLYYSKTNEKKLFENRAHEIINFMVDKQYIDRGRFQFETIQNATKANTMEVVNPASE